jgi:general secretion pathway protein M
VAPRPLPDRSRTLALAFAVLLLGYLVLLHWWFTAPMLRMGGEIEVLRAQEQSLRLESAQRPKLEQRLAQVRAFEAGNPGFLPEANKELASAGLVQRLQQVVSSASPNPNACQITAQTPTDMPTQEPFPRVMVQVRLRCGMRELSAVLHALESGSPQLFIDNLDLLSRRSYLVAGGENAGALDVSFDLYGYLKVASQKAASAGGRRG